MYDIQIQAINETRERCCENCNKYYFEACTGIRRYFERIDGCKKALEVYTERFNKLTDWKNKY